MLIDLEVRQATAHEASEVGKFVFELIEEFAPGQGLSLEATQATAQEVLPDDSIVAFLAIQNGKPIGAMTLNTCDAIYAGGKFGEISELYVVTEARSMGVAKALIKSAVAFGKEQDWKRLEVGAPPQPEWARTLAFYLREGFEEVGPRLRFVL